MFARERYTEMVLECGYIGHFTGSYTVCVCAHVYMCILINYGSPVLEVIEEVLMIGDVVLMNRSRRMLFILCVVRCWTGLVRVV